MNFLRQRSPLLLKRNLLALNHRSQVLKTFSTNTVATISPDDIIKECGKIREGIQSLNDVSGISIYSC